MSKSELYMQSVVQHLAEQKPKRDKPYEAFKVALELAACDLGYWNAISAFEGIAKEIEG